MSRRRVYPARPVYPEPRRALEKSPRDVYLSNRFIFNQFRTLFYPERSRRACPERMRGVRSRSISFVVSRLHTLFCNGVIATPFPSITCALFPMQWGVWVPGNAPTSSFPYILPSSVCSKSFCFTLFQKLPGWGAILPILELSWARISTFVFRVSYSAPTANRQRPTPVHGTRATSRISIFVFRVSCSIWQSAVTSRRRVPGES